MLSTPLGPERPPLEVPPRCLTCTLPCPVRPLSCAFSFVPSFVYPLTSALHIERLSERRRNEREDGERTATMAATNDKTSSVFVTKEKFEVAAKDVGLSAEVADALWSKLGESSSQRIIAGATAPRQDAANVNNWHWSEIDMLPWAKERLEGICLGVEGKGVPDKGWVKVTKMEKCEGEASVSNRKGKRIVAFELKVTCKWEGQVDYDDVSGELLLPYVSEDIEDANDFEVKLSAKEPGDASHKKALKFLTAQLPTLREGLKAFKDEIHKK